MGNWNINEGPEIDVFGFQIVKKQPERKAANEQLPRIAGSKPTVTRVTFGMHLKNAFSALTRDDQISSILLPKTVPGNRVCVDESESVAAIFGESLQQHSRSAT